jgi:hypothetical protein
VVKRLTEIQRLPLEHIAEQHRGLTSAIAATYIEAATICLSRHHQPPVTFEVIDDDLRVNAELAWVVPNLRAQLAWANEIDATEAGAYGCAIAAVALSRGLYAVRRAETLTGADYYVAPEGYGLEDLEGCYRLEISGTHLDTMEVNRRLNAKLRQVRLGNSNLPAIAAVVGFRVLRIVIKTLEDQ